MASRWRRRSATTIRASPLFSPAVTTTWCKRRKTGSRFCASRFSYPLWTSPFVKLSNAAQRGMMASACCNSRVGAARSAGNECGEHRESMVSLVVLCEQQNGPACGEHGDPDQVEVDPSPAQKIDAGPVVDDE